MESTGVYWMPVFEILQERGLDPRLLEPGEIKNSPGRKTDVCDAQWIPQLHAYGLLEGSFIPPEPIDVLRTYMRQKEMLVESSSQHIQHMQKAMMQMNVQLHHVLSDITGETGQRIISAILAGERDPQELAAQRHARCKIKIFSSHLCDSRQGTGMADDFMQRDSHFTQLVTDQHQQLRGFVRTLGVDPDWVDDLAQEVFLVAWRERDAFDQQRDIGKWLRGIARNLVRNELRKDQRRRRILHEGLSELLVRSLEGEPEVAVWEQCRMPALRDCVEQLAPKSRQIVAGRYSDGWKAPDLADHLGMTAAAVRQALMRIREQLKQCIEVRMVEG